MKTGKLPEPVLERSVLRPLLGVSRPAEERMGVGLDGARFCQLKDETLVLTTQTSVGEPSPVWNVIQRAVNNLAAKRAVPAGVLVSLLVPEETDEEQLRKLMQEIARVCEKLQLTVLGGHTEVSRQVQCAVLTVTGVGLQSAELLSEHTAAAGDDLVVTKWIGLSGTALAAEYKENSLRERYPQALIDEAKGFSSLLSVLPEAQIAAKEATAMHDASRSGIFGALWELAKEAGLGLTVDLKKLPLRQETVEVCDCLELNPYQIDAGGSLVIATRRGAAVVQALAAAGIEAVVVGHLQEGHDRVITNEGELRYLEPPRTEEMQKLWLESEKM